MFFDKILFDDKKTTYPEILFKYKEIATIIEEKAKREPIKTYFCIDQILFLEKNNLAWDRKLLIEKTNNIGQQKNTSTDPFKTNLISDEEPLLLSGILSLKQQKLNFSHFIPSSCFDPCPDINSDSNLKSKPSKSIPLVRDKPLP